VVSYILHVIGHHPMSDKIKKPFVPIGTKGYLPWCHPYEVSLTHPGTNIPCPCDNGGHVRDELLIFRPPF